MIGNTSFCQTFCTQVCLWVCGCVFHTFIHFQVFWFHHDWCIFWGIMISCSAMCLPPFSFSSCDNAKTASYGGRGRYWVFDNRVRSSKLRSCSKKLYPFSTSYCLFLVLTALSIFIVLAENCSLYGPTGLSYGLRTAPHWPKPCAHYPASCCWYCRHSGRGGGGVKISLDKDKGRDYPVRKRLVKYRYLSRIYREIQYILGP